MLGIRENCSKRDISEVINRSLERLSGILFPQKCMKCSGFIDGQPLSKSASGPEVFQPYFCSGCQMAGYDPFEPPFCNACGMKFNTEASRLHLCGSCLAGRPHAGRVRAGGMYSGILKDAVHLLKYSSRLSLARPMGYLLFSAYVQYFSDISRPLLVPIPLHVSKLKHRGFNQSFLIARALSKRTSANPFRPGGLEIDAHSMIRKRKTPSQTDFSVEQRLRNVKDAFTVVKPGKIEGRRIVLVDDVYTTGATCNEAANTLLNAGARSVDTLVAARAF